jgi:hypothetical protein
VAVTEPVDRSKLIRSGLYVMPNRLRSMLSCARSVTRSGLAATTSAVMLTGSATPAASSVPATFSVVASDSVARRTDTTTRGCSATAKKSAERRCLSRCLFPVVSDAASMTSCPVTVPSGATVPSPLTRSKRPRTVIVFQKCRLANSTLDCPGTRLH